MYKKKKRWCNIIVYVRPRWKLVSFHMELEPRRLIFSFPSSCLHRTRPDGDERLSDWRTALVSTFDSFLTVFLYCLSFYPLNPRLPTSSMFVLLLFFSWHTFYLKVPFPSSANQSFISSNCHLMPAHLWVSSWFPEMVGSNIPSHIFFFFFLRLTFLLVLSSPCLNGYDDKCWMLHLLVVNKNLFLKRFSVSQLWHLFPRNT